LLGVRAPQPDHSFYISCFHDLVHGQPDIKSFCALTAELHNRSSDLNEQGQILPKPGGRFGFHVATPVGKMPQDNNWADTWEEFFARGLRRILDYESITHGHSQELSSLAVDLLQKVIPRLLRPLERQGRTVRPTSIHGDLQIRNVKLDKESRRLIIFDAGSFWGHNE